LDLFPRDEKLSFHQRDRTKETSHRQTLKQRRIKSSKPYIEKPWINPRYNRTGGATPYMLTIVEE
jgi:hypothetical protein